MTWLCSLMGAGLIFLLPLAVAQTTTKPHRLPSATTHAVPTSKSAARAKATSPEKSPVPLKRVSTGSSASLRSRKSSSHSRVKKPPVPSYQLHPDPERYQQIQQSLVDRGFFKGSVDGNWNDDSVQALHDFQSANQLDPDGKINSLTLMKLGLGPKHDGSSAPLSPKDAVPSPGIDVPPPPATLPPETETTPQ